MKEKAEAALREHLDVQKRRKRIKAYLIRVAVECGMDQTEAIKGDPVKYLETYLKNQGVTNE